MNVSKWFSGLFSQRGKTEGIYQRGMKKAHDKDLDGAIADYSAVINDPQSPADLKAMALFNRALVYSLQKKFEEANADLERVQAIPEAPRNLRDATREKLERIRKEQLRRGAHDE